MQDLNIGLLQFDQSWENKTRNYQKIHSFLKDKKEFDLLLLPEMFHTGFTMNVEMSETMVNSQGINFLKELSKEKQCAIFTSLIIQEKGHFFNRGVFIQPDEQVIIYDKRKTFGLAGEDKIFDCGKSKIIVEYKGWKLNLQICYDLRFPELSGNRVDNGVALYDASLFIANWPEKRSEHWKTLLKARAIENQSYVLACNRVGKDANKLSYSGDSCIIDALGSVLSSSTEEGLIVFKIKKEPLREIRKNLPFLKDK
jgi:predicted amidohydrolase